MAIQEPYYQLEKEPYYQLELMYRKLVSDISVHNAAKFAYEESCLKCSKVKENLKHLNFFLHLTEVFESTLKEKKDLTKAERAIFLEYYDRTSKTFPVLLQAEPQQKIMDLIQNVLLHGPEIKQHMEIDLEACEETSHNTSDLKIIEATKVKLNTTLDKYARKFTSFVHSHARLIDELSKNLNRPQ